MVAPVTSPEAPVAPTVTTPVPPPPRARRGASRRAGDTLGIVWVHGGFHAATFRRQHLEKSWTSPTSVRTVEEFTTALDDALTATGFGASEMFLVLGHESFVHQMENAPPFSESAARTYLRGRVERFEKEHESVLWVSQRAASVRKDSTYVLHMLPGSFYYQLNQALLARRLDLTRILPLLVPLQLELGTLGEAKDQPVLVAAEAGDATAVFVMRPGGEMLFSRTTMVSWKSEPARVAVEINRSLLYAKQQFGATVDRLWLLGSDAESARADVAAKCGATKQINVRPAGAEDWLRIVAKLSPRHPINLVAGYLRQKRRRQFYRRLMLAGCWLVLALLAFDAWNKDQSWSTEKTRLRALAADEAEMHAEHMRLAQRNDEAERQRTFARQVVDDRLPPVPGKFLAYVAGILPREARLSDFSVKWDDSTDQWAFHIDGTIEADEETARASIAALRRQLTKSPLRVRLIETARASAAVTINGENVLQRFTLDGGLFEH